MNTCVSSFQLTFNSRALTEAIKAGLDSLGDAMKGKRPSE